MSRELKQQVVDKLQSEIESKIQLHKEKMEQIQQSIHKNEPKAGYDEDNSKGELLNDYERHAKLREEHEDQLLKLKDDIHPEEFVAASPGALVCTDRSNFMISAGLGEIKVDQHQRFLAISEKSPIYESMAGKKYGEQFSYDGNDFKVKGVY